MQIDPSIFKAYDIRGVYPTNINAELAYKIAQAYLHFINPQAKGLNIVLGRDVRTSGPELAEAIKKAITEAGSNVVDIGLASTDMMYFAVANYGYDGGLQITASHNPREYNGIKMVRKGAVPISGDTGIYDIRDLVVSGYNFISENHGSVSNLDNLPDYVKKVLSVIDAASIKPMTVVANINFGFTAAVLSELAKVLPVTFTMINEQPNGEFPKGPPDPLLVENRGETIELIKKVQPNFGAAWDSDADRCYFFDETGRFLSGYFTSAVLAEYFLKKYPRSKVVIDMKQNWAIKDVVAAAGGTALPNRTGHSFFKERMIKEDAVFGGEVSGHFFFKDFFYLDNGIIPFLLILEMLSTTGKKLSEIYQPYFDKYFAIEETNLEVVDVPRVLDALKKKYSDGVLSEIDGVSIDYPDWRFNVRSSNTQPLVRLNLEAKTLELMKEKTEEITALIKM